MNTVEMMMLSGVLRGAEYKSPRLAPTRELFPSSWEKSRERGCPEGLLEVRQRERLVRSMPPQR
ncbi:hypothetical protein [Nitrospira sp. KM1]|uniref:hypothetical protein n=1 Tax=Nitrospira sp. KM1 TaxID=1936990 RepID=UPI001564C86B|nr:hypothetical protein [Nitrospira sp. KM1]